MQSERNTNLPGLRVGVQRRVASIWCQLLGLDSVDLDDSFFDVGGDSLRVGVMRDRIACEFGVELSPAALLDLPTVRLIADCVLQSLGGGERGRATDPRPAKDRPMR